MHVLMLGWEFPPFIAGGLGTACHGLTKAMDRRGMSVTFVLPKVIDRSESSHVNLMSPDILTKPGANVAKTVTHATDVAGSASQSAQVSPPASPSGSSAASSAGSSPVTEAQVASITQSAPPLAEDPKTREAFEHVRFIGVPAGFNNPYQRTVGNQPAGRWVIRRGMTTFLADEDAAEAGDEVSIPYSALQAAATAHSTSGASTHTPLTPPPGDDYGGDLLQQVHRFEQFVLAACRNLVRCHSRP
jgi:hypothetical protein